MGPGEKNTKAIGDGGMRLGGFALLLGFRACCSCIRNENLNRRALDSKRSFEYTASFHLSIEKRERPRSCLPSPHRSMLNYPIAWICPGQFFVQIGAHQSRHYPTALGRCPNTLGLYSHQPRPVLCLYFLACRYRKLLKGSSVNAVLGSKSSFRCRAAARRAAAQ